MDNHILLEIEEKLLSKNSKIQQILDITLEQAKVMEGSKLEEFCELLVLRQQVMNEVDQIDNEVNISNWPIDEEDFLNNNPRISKLKIETQSLVELIVAQNKENYVKFNQEFAVLKQKLKGFNHNKTLHQAYQPTQKSQGFGYFIDKKK